ncbi:phosphomannomutase/phosphoglucomutase [Candidatus Falkowbacteria bacterium]|jgi:phosphomannomutase|nr:phosphomannomutase/phosphoglucomutase [Candidatus Falkowbacteria bacterium]MBT5503179.1 phosphomannomutase/phosphoglucomutase [Candidatus Falkowbacteria bacterium]MBT7348479.1 phosphomannomutase/phosphoglucomutase [Candidatus Falkowbacteria bacterium]MBT7500856.1 phosphomannomutase/phosphoglucomutase [Candidatus Falkowbacteria bacterium]
MQIDQLIFKAYDFRGIYPDQFNEEIMERVGQAFVLHFQIKELVLGWDMRISSPQMSQAFIRGATKQGAKVITLGLVSTDTVYFASGKYQMAGAMITASHNPKDYIGIKFCLSGAQPVGKESGLTEMKELVLKNEFTDSEVLGQVEGKDGILEEFAEHVYTFIDKEKIKPLKIVVDAGNGMAGKIVPAIFNDLPCEIIPLYFELDGTFPNHQPSPIEIENNLDLIAKVKETNADLGLAFDGDADRVFFVDEKGDMIDSSWITAMVAKKLLEKNPGATIIRNVVVSKAVPEVVEKMGGKAFTSKVGHSYIKQDMKETGAVFAGEHSGHYYFKDNYRADSGIIATVIVLQMLSEEGKSFSETIKEFQTYYRIEETNSEVEDKDEIIAKLKERFGDNLTQAFDGGTFEFEDWWFNVRPSNTEPLLRLNLEAKTEELMKEKRDEILEIIRTD